MIVTIEQNITSGDSFEVPFPVTDNLMDGKKDFSVVVKAVGGVNGGGDVTMSLSVYADIGPAAHPVNGTDVDTESWSNITRGIYRPDLNQMVDADSVDFAGATAAVAWLDMDDFNADRVKFMVSLSGAPTVTPASLIIKSRRDSL